MGCVIIAMIPMIGRKSVDQFIKTFKKVEEQLILSFLFTDIIEFFES